MAKRNIKPSNPVINRKHPLSQGLVFDANFFQRGGDTKELVFGKVGTLTNGPTWQTREYGACIDFVPDNDVVSFSSVPKIGDIKYRTFEFLVRMEGGGTAGYGHILKTEDPTDGEDFLDLQNDNYSGGWGFVYYAGYTNRERIWSIPHLTLNVWSHVIIRHKYTGDYTVDPAPEVWVNGIKQTVTDRWNNSVSRSFEAEQNVFIGNRAGADEGWDGQVSHVRIWGRFLPDNEIQQLVTDPFCFYVKSRLSLAKAAAGTAYSSTITEAVTIVDSISKQTSRTILDVTVIVDNIIKETARIIVDTAALVDNIIKSCSRSIQDAATIVDSIVKQISRSISDVVTTVDSFVRSLSKTVVDTVTGVDLFSGIKVTTKVLSETVSIVDTILRQIARAYSEAVTIVDSKIRGLSKTIKEKVHIIDYKGTKTAVSDFEAPSAGNLVAPTGGVLFGGNGTYKGVANDFSKNGAQSFKIAASSVMDGGVYFQLTGMKAGSRIGVSVYVKTDANVVNAAITLDTAQHGIGGSSQQTVSVGANNNGYVLNRRFLCDATQVNIFLGLGSFGPDSQGTVWFDDLILYVEGPTFSLARTLSDVATIVDTLKKSTSRALSETVIIVDSIVRTYFRAFSETVTIVDNVTKMCSRVISESVSIVDTISAGLLSKMKKGETYLFSKIGRTVTMIKTRKRGILKTKGEDKTVLQ